MKVFGINQSDDMNKKNGSNCKRKFILKKRFEFANNITTKNPTECNDELR